MSIPNSPSPDISERAAYDAVIVGASLAGCTTATFLSRAGARVALVEKQPDPKAYKRMCSHFIQASAVPTMERLGVLEPALAAGGLRTQMRAWTAWGWIEPPADSGNICVNLRREVLDPLLRERTAAEPGVDLMLGLTVERVLSGRGAVRGVVVSDREGRRTELRAALTIGADGRDSSVAELAKLPSKSRPHGRIAYGGYFEGAAPASAPDSSIWLLDPQWAAAFPTDSRLTFYGVMVTKDRLPEFKRDPAKALVSFVGNIPDAPPIREGRLASQVMGKVDMTNRERGPVGPGIALVGDAALAIDPLFGVGCGWAFQSGEWLADSVAPALRGEEPLERGLSRYRRQRARALRGHSFLIHDYASGRRLSAVERMLFAAAARDRETARLFEDMGTRQVGPERLFPRMLPRAIAVNARHALAR